MLVVTRLLLQKQSGWEHLIPFSCLSFVIGAAVAAWGCYRSKLMAWVGSLFVLVYSILGIFSIGLLTLPGAVLLIIGAAFKTVNKST